MAQPPFKTDVLQIEPAATGTRTISRDAVAGELKFIDPSFPSGVLLADLVGIQTISNTTVVGTGGGAQFTTIQAAIDALPTTGSATNPQVIMLFPGTYNEKLTIDKDGVVLAEIVNQVRVIGGTWRGSSSTSLAVVSQTASFTIDGVEWVNGIEVAYDTGLDEPDASGEGWAMRNVGRAETLLINLIGAGSTLVSNCPIVGHTTHNGDRTFRAVGSGFGNLLVEDTVAATLVNCTRGTVGGVGSGTLQETALVGTVAFVASASEVVAFGVAQPDASYTVVLDVPSLAVTAAVTSRTASSFTVETSAPFTGSIGYSVVRQIT